MTSQLKELQGDTFELDQEYREDGKMVTGWQIVGALEEEIVMLMQKAGVLLEKHAEDFGSLQEKFLGLIKKKKESLHWQDALLLKDAQSANVLWIYRGIWEGGQQADAAVSIEHPKGYTDYGNLSDFQKKITPEQYALIMVRALNAYLERNLPKEWETSGHQRFLMKATKDFLKEQLGHLNIV